MDAEENARTEEDRTKTLKTTLPRTTTSTVDDEQRKRHEISVASSPADGEISGSGGGPSRERIGAWAMAWSAGGRGSFSGPAADDDMAAAEDALAAGIARLPAFASVKHLTPTIAEAVVETEAFPGMESEVLYERIVEEDGDGGDGTGDGTGATAGEHDQRAGGGSSGSSGLFAAFDDDDGADDAGAAAGPAAAEPAPWVAAGRRAASRGGSGSGSPATPVATLPSVGVEGAAEDVEEAAYSAAAVLKKGMVTKQGHSIKVATPRGRLPPKEMAGRVAHAARVRSCSRWSWHADVEAAAPGAQAARVCVLSRRRGACRADQSMVRHLRPC